ncbi:MAG: hypothetical protein GXO77_09405 [Calditrichaeota bacterium]|nr:hypothetical protein [Calditrichota bacterium]
MESNSFSIAIIARSTDRFLYFKNTLKETCQRIVSLSFDKRIEISLSEESFDLVLVDISREPAFDLQAVQHLIEYKNLKQKIFIFILNPSQESAKLQIYRLPNSQILFEPVDKFSLLTAVNTALQLSRLQNRIRVYKDILEGEQKLITYMDDLLEIEQIHQCDRFQEVKEYLLSSFVKKVELTLAVEKAFFGFFEEDGQRLVVEQKGKKKNQLERVVYFSLEKSATRALLNQNKVHIFDKADLADPLVQEMEEFLGFKIFSLLFAPVLVYHRPFGAIILINKIYRETFYENDMSFTMAAAQRIAFNIEGFLIEHQDEAAIKTFPTNLFEHDASNRYQIIKNILDTVYFGVVVFDDQSQIHFINPGATRILNVQKPVNKIHRLQDILKANIIQEITRVIKAKPLPIIRHEIQLEKRLFPNSYIGLSIYPLKLEPEKQHYIMVFSEITQTKRIQAEIIRMDRMASLGVLSAGIAHEIRNPLAGIKAMAQSLEDELENDPGKLEYISRILRQVSRLEKLLKAFFSYARPVRPDPSRCSIKKIISEVLPLIQSRFRERNVKIETEYADDLADVFVDQNQIQQVLLNLFINAIDAMPEGGNLKILARNSETVQPVIDRRNRIPTLLSDKFIEILISDTGVGMSSDILEQIFNPFFTTKSQGTGLGLSIVYQIIKEHGGQIEVRSAPGKGSTFIIFLPAV